MPELSTSRTIKGRASILGIVHDGLLQTDLLRDRAFSCLGEGVLIQIGKFR